MSEVVSDSSRPALAKSFTVAGRSVRIEAEDEWGLSLFERQFSATHFQPLPSDTDPARDAVITVFGEGSAPPPVPAGLETFEVALGGLCHTDGHTSILHTDDSIIRTGGDAFGGVEVWVGSTPRARELGALSRVVSAAMMTALRRCGLFEIHGAGVVEPSSGVGVLLVGPGGSGKSTLAAQLAAEGWGYLSDDSLLACANGTSVETHALRRHFAVTEPTLAAGGLAGLDPEQTEPLPLAPLKRAFEPQTVFPDRFLGACRPEALFFPVVTLEPESRTEPLPQFEAMSRLMKLYPWACYDRATAREHLDVLTRLVRQCESYELRAGRDLFGDAPRTARFISARLRGSR
jgi:hypothetical protein